MNKYKKAKKVKHLLSKLQGIVEQQRTASNPKWALELHYEYKDLQGKIKKLGDVAER